MYLIPVIDLQSLSPEVSFFQSKTIYYVVITSQGGKGALFSPHPFISRNVLYQKAEYLSPQLRGAGSYKQKLPNLHFSLVLKNSQWFKRKGISEQARSAVARAEGWVVLEPSAKNPDSAPASLFTKKKDAEFQLGAAMEAYVINKQSKTNAERFLCSGVFSNID